MLRFVNRVARLPAPLPAVRLPRVSFYSTSANPPASDVDIKFQVSYECTTNTDPPTTPDFSAAKVLESWANSMHVNVKKTDNGTIFNVHELNKISSKQLLNRISVLLDEPNTQIKDVNILTENVDTKHKYNLNLSIKRVWTEKVAAKENSTPEKMEMEMEMEMEGSKKMEKKDLEKKMEMEMKGSKKMEKKDLEKKMEDSKKMKMEMEMDGSKKMEKKDLEKKEDLEVYKSTTCEVVDEKFMIWKLCKLFTMQNEEVVELKVRMRRKNQGAKHSDSIQFVVERPTEEQSKKMEMEKKNMKAGFSMNTNITSQELDEVYLIKNFFALLKSKNVEIAEVKVRMRKNEGGVKHSNLIQYTVEKPPGAY